MKKKRKSGILYYGVGVIIILLTAFSAFGIKNSIPGYVARENELERIQVEKDYIFGQLNSLEINVSKREGESNQGNTSSGKKINRIDIRVVGSPPDEDRAFTKGEARLDIIKQ